jgi:Ketopantoate reductase
VRWAVSLGAKLARAGLDVRLIARGPHLAAIRADGLTIEETDGATWNARAAATDDPAEAGPQDFVILTLKAHQVPPMVDRLKPLFHETTAVVTAMNGIPWWYFYRLDGPWRDRRLDSVDPGGRQWEVIGPNRAIGCVVFPAGQIVRPGVVRHTYGDRLPLGEPDGARSDRVAALSKALIAAGLRAPVKSRIRDDIWVKLWGNVAFNPVSALTGATLEAIARDPGTRALCRAVMLEAQEVAEKLGARFAVDVETRIEGAASVGPHKTSMLQDLEAGRPLELDAIMGAVQELGRIVGVATPQLDAVLALVRLRARPPGRPA